MNKEDLILHLVQGYRCVVDPLHPHENGTIKITH